MEYTPPQAQASTEKPSYELKTDITGKEPPKRGPITIKDLKGNEFRVPYRPKKNCAKCYGRGYIGNDPKSGEMLICKRCYPIAK